MYGCVVARGSSEWSCVGDCSSESASSSAVPIEHALPGQQSALTVAIAAAPFTGSHDPGNIHMTDAALALLPVNARLVQGRLSRSCLVSKLPSRKALNALVLSFPVVYPTTQSKEKEACLCHEKQV